MALLHLASPMQSASLYHRELHPAAESTNLIPPAQGVSVSGPTGDTFISLKIMERDAKKYAHEAKKLARKLKGKNLETTVQNIREWVYHNFQYQADAELQKIRTLSYAFHQDREAGIDCKSYSVIISQILQNLGVKHYFRKIKQRRTAPSQPANYEDQYSHVYVVVPKNQDTGSLKSGYHVLDAVPSYTAEPPHIAKYDQKVSVMPNKHVSLHGLAGADDDCQGAILEKSYKTTNAQGLPVVIFQIRKADGSQKSLQAPCNKESQALATLNGLGCNCSPVLGNPSGGTPQAGTGASNSSSDGGWVKMAVQFVADNPDLFKDLFKGGGSGGPKMGSQKWMENKVNEWKNNNVMWLYPRQEHGGSWPKKGAGDLQSMSRMELQYFANWRIPVYIKTIHPDNNPSHWAGSNTRPKVKWGFVAAAYALKKHAEDIAIQRFGCYSDLPMFDRLVENFDPANPLAPQGMENGPPYAPLNGWCTPGAGSGGSGNGGGSGGGSGGGGNGGGSGGGSGSGSGGATQASIGKVLGYGGGAALLLYVGNEILKNRNSNKNV